MQATQATNLGLYDNYIMAEPFTSMRKGGRFDQSTILKYEDGSEWIFLNNVPKERFCGFLYLQNALKESGLNNVFAAENKMTMHNHQIIYLSRYCGEKRPEYFEHKANLQTLSDKIGFTDTAGCANLREEDGKIYVFDTEKHSFDPTVRHKIDSFIPLHDAIKASLEELLAEPK